MPNQRCAHKDGSVNREFQNIYQAFRGGIGAENVDARSVAAAVAPHVDTLLDITPRLDYINQGAGLAGVHNVTYYGAIGDGSADDTAAIQAAIDAAEAAGGGIVYFPAGAYLTSDTLTVDTDGVSLRGVGRTSIIKADSGFAGVLLEIDGVTFKSVGIHDMYFDGSSGAGVTYGVQISGIKNCYFSNFTVENVTAGTALYLDGTTEPVWLSTFVNFCCRTCLNGIKFTGLDASNFVNRNWFYGGEVVVTTGIGVQLGDSNKWVQTNTLNMYYGGGNPNIRVYGNYNILEGWAESADSNALEIMSGADRTVIKCFSRGSDPIVDNGDNTLYRGEVVDAWRPCISQPIVDGDGDPNANDRNFLITANTSPTSLNRLDNGIDGQTMWVVFGDSNTTVKFKETPTAAFNLQGNGGNEWEAKEHDAMFCVFQHTGGDPLGYWHCVLCRASGTKGSELTISSGAITATTTYHRVDTESDDVSDNLDTINGGVTGELLTLRAADSGRTVTVRDASVSSGNIYLSGGTAFDLDHVQDVIQLIAVSATVWLEVSRSDNE